MKLCYFHNANYSGKSANTFQVAQMCNAFSRAGVITTLLSFAIDKKPPTLNASVKRLNVSHSKNYTVRTFQLIWQVLRSKADLFFTRDLLVAFFCKLLHPKTKLIYELHGIQKNILWTFLLRLILPLVDLKIAISQGLVDTLPQYQWLVLHDGINVEDTVNLKKSEARKKIRISNKATVAYVGALKRDRDLQTLFDVASRNPQIQFVFYGSDKYEIFKKKIAENIIYKGFTREPYVVYAAADVLFAGFTDKVPTIKYMSPLKVFEYMLSKRPIVVTDCDRIRDILDESEAYFYSQYNSKSLEKSITLAIKDTKKATRAYKKVVKKYTWDERIHVILSRI